MERVNRQLLNGARQQSHQVRCGEIDRRIAAVIEGARGRSRDTVVYLAMTELQKLCPDFTQVELMGLYSEVLDRLDGAGEAGLR